MSATPRQNVKVNVLGVGVDAVDMPAAIAHIRSALNEGRNGYVCVTGVHGIMESHRDTALRQIHNEALACLPDGMPLTWVGRLRGLRTMNRVYGPDLMSAICALSVTEKWTHFLYGGKPGVAERLRQELERRFPGIRIVGSYCPPFRALNEAEERELSEQLAAARPDLLWVGLSTPKQERFMAQYHGCLDTKVMLGVGAAFDILAGLLPEAPAWVKRIGMQWFHRLCIEPRRLAGRYLRNNPLFLFHIFLQLTHLRRYTLDPSLPTTQSEGADHAVRK